MQISDLLYHKPTSDTIPSPIDPTYFKDLKKHLDKNPDYIKSRIEWRKFNPSILDMYTVKERFFEYYKANDLPTFHNDIELFVRNHPDLSVEDGAKMFCEKYRGYDGTYGREFVERAITRCKHEEKAEC